jgi:hypothetical protein
VINLAILQRVNPVLIQQAKKCLWKDVLSRNPEVSPGGATARIHAATRRLAASIDRRIAICGEFPFAKVRHDRFDVLCDLGGLSSAPFCPDVASLRIAVKLTALV